MPYFHMISIIIPVYNESENIRTLIDYLNSNAFGYIGEIIVVDGGSTDNIHKQLIGYPNVKYISTERGRAKQMNVGAKTAKRSILYFLHADSFPPKYFDRSIYETLLFNKNIKAGCFMLRFDSNHWWLKIMGRATTINRNFCRGGDQSLFVDRELFLSLNGFDENYVIYEDNDFTKKLYRTTRFKVIKKPITTSARHYEKMGIWKLQYLHLRIYIKKWLGAEAKELNTFYKKNMEEFKLTNRI